MMIPSMKIIFLFRLKMKSISMIVGGKIREIRRRNCLNIGELAEMVGVSQQQMSRYERGVNKLCPDILYKLSVVFHCNIDDFFSDLPSRDYLCKDYHDDTSVIIEDYFRKK